MKTALNKLALVMASLMWAACMWAQGAADDYDLTLDQNIHSPAVPKKAKEGVRSVMDQLRRSLIKNKLDAHSMREGEVIAVTIPCEQLFAPCDTALLAGGKTLLARLAPVVRERERYKILVAVHTDDTGDDMYADSISATRANVIDDYLYTLSGGLDTNVVPYGLGKDEPRQPNTTRAGRAANRRTDIYIVPYGGLLRQLGVK